MAGTTYILSEAFDGLRRTWLSSLISIVIITFLLILLGIFGVLEVSVDHIVDVLNAKMDIQVFISEVLHNDEIEQLQSDIRNIGGIKDVSLHSKEQAAEEFRQKFGKEIFDILQDNPLPASFTITLNENQRSARKIESVAKQLQKMRGIDEVLYHNQVLSLLANYSHTAKLVLTVLILFVSLGSFFIVANTIRLIIVAKQQIIKTMRLVGATKKYIRRPYLLEGMLQGIIAGIGAAFFLYLLTKIVNFQLPGLIFISDYFFVAIVLIGFIYGLIGSLLAIKRFL
jgi:cell division transport system permease protein